jgi:hypothetical protein
MKNVNAFEGDAFSFYKTVCSKKQDVALVARLAAMDADIQALYNTYDHHFQGNMLETLDPNGYNHGPKADLVALYDYGSATMTALRNQLNTTPHGRVVKCQSCTINSGSTFDHIVPQGEFAEFIVHPRNLIGQCADCNPRKNANWRLGGKRTTLNLYLDALPQVQYLFVTADVGNDAIETEFYLDNRNGVNADLFELISNHYQRLDLFRRFSDEADSVITSLRNIMDPLKLLGDVAQSKAIVLESITREQNAFGHNYWQSILKLELINSEDFMIDYE